MRGIVDHNYYIECPIIPENNLYREFTIKFEIKFIKSVEAQTSESFQFKKKIYI